MLGEILLALPIIVTISVLIYCIYGCIKEEYSREGWGISIFICLCILIFFISVVLMAYNSALYSPYEYNSYCDTIDETKELLTVFEDNTDIGQGLEALELKQTISETIKLKNQLHAGIEAYLINPFMPFKDVMRSGLPSDF